MCTNHCIILYSLLVINGLKSDECLQSRRDQTYVKHSADGVLLPSRQERKEILKNLALLAAWRLFKYVVDPYKYLRESAKIRVQYLVRIACLSRHIGDRS